ncbi:hypothetical protein [Burkholderia multivorans]|uniref:hypothetical protein n=1 Tax=Burkholderia multivorans TaxID=87883 RepID=UPI0011B29814|nr:hypothetical protein [Burkholderia multivorans]
MKRNTALEMQAEEFDFFKKHEPETQQKPSKQEPAIEALWTVISVLLAIAVPLTWYCLGQMHDTEMKAFCIKTQLDTEICSTGRIGPKELNTIVQRVQEDAIVAKIVACPDKSTKGD